ncbi:hypothetical protein [Bosea minatitlanensis]|uniref:Uncharacterized protein n=1 Tax=Bosea minatitlanensis TaxID=128782 RepID=A0ABW0F184_9HYPH|nr:hypothetical protein [Bosea minatitlanensis]MCT4491802.1 hypothetical protein [Bosea minatitlanensis]
MAGENIRINFGTTQRGFKIARFIDVNDQICSLQKSSLMAPPECIWLGLDDENRMHLSRELVRALLPALQHFADTGELP